MDFMQPINRINTRTVRMVLIYSVVALLGGNYLLYAFFELGNIRNIVRAAGAGGMLLLLLLRFADGKLRRRQVLMLGLAVWQILSGGTNGLNIAFLLILSAAVAGNRDCKITTAVFWVMVVLTAVMMTSLLLGIEENTVYKVGTRTRHMLGFVNVNSASMFLFTLLTSWLLYRDQNTKPADLIAVIILELIIFRFTDSRTPLLGIFMMAMLYLLLPRLPKKLVSVCCYAGVAFLFVSAYLWVLPAVNSEPVNKLLSLRPMYCDEYFRSQNALTFLLGGTRVKELDNGYLLLMFNAGVIVYTTVYFVIQSAIRNLLRQRAYMKAAFVLTMLACSVLEGSALRPELLCAPVLWVVVLEALPGEGPESILIGYAEAWVAGHLNKAPESDAE